MIPLRYHLLGTWRHGCARAALLENRQLPIFKCVYYCGSGGPGSRSWLPGCVCLLSGRTCCSSPFAGRGQRHFPPPLASGDAKKEPRQQVQEGLFPLFLFYQPEPNEHLADSRLFLCGQLWGRLPFGISIPLILRLGKAAEFLGLGYGKIADMEAIPLLDPCLEVLIGGAFCL